MSLLFLFLILFSCSNHMYIQLAIMEENSTTNRLWTVQCFRLPVARAWMASLITVESGTEVCATMWTEGTEAGLEVGVFTLC